MEDRPTKVHAGLALSGLAVAAFIAYGDTFGNAFVYPHIADIAENPTIRHLGDLGAVLDPPTTGGMTVGGRPLLNLSFAVNYALGGTNPWGYHAVNLLIHILAGWVLFGIVRRTMGAASHGIAFAAALLWLLHPLQTESVTYVIERAESLMGLFYLTTIYCFIRYSPKVERVVPDALGTPSSRSSASGTSRSTFRSSASGTSRSTFRSSASGTTRSTFKPWAILSVVCCLLGMATKEVMATAPVIVLLYDRTFVAGSFRAALKSRGRYYAALAATWIVVIALALGNRDRGGTAGTSIGGSWFAYAETQFGAVAHYLRLALWPSPLIFDYGSQWVTHPVSILLPAVVVIAVAGASLWLFFQAAPGRRAGGFLGLFFFAILAPTSLVPVVVQTSAEHRMYLALAPLAVAFAWAVRAGLARLGAAKLAWPLLILFGLSLGVVTAARNLDYQDNLTLWGLTARQNPQNPRAHYYYGVSLDEAGRPADAMGQFQSALALDPNYPEAHNRLGIDLLGSGKTFEAMQHYAEAIRLRPSFAQAHYNLGTAYAQMGQLQEGEAELSESVRLDPTNPDALNNLGLTLAGMGRWSEAIQEYRAALRIDPSNRRALANLAAARRAQ